ncbi:unnamed protein product [Brachionus calyciflorus]|uniref:Uncharacterized protein n=1 Tax=Brachionus calyciflorus TaxID=104777 RepID=A0A813W7X1_9BILA|nr:unnamed protein product [Brachionus calyciflorus]
MLKKRAFIKIVPFFLIVFFFLNYKNKNSNESYYSLNDKIAFNSSSKIKWIVVTSISEPTEQCKKLSSIPDFQLVVVADKKTTNTWHLDNTIFLSVSDQESLKFKSIKTTPYYSYTRKNIGYLFAIQNGAQFIYDTDDDNAPTVNINEYFNFKENDYGLVYDCSVESKILNPYAHFGQPQIWPRGYPLSEIEKNYNNSYVSGRRKCSIVQQGVVNGDPDVDAIFRLTKSMEYRKIDLYFDPSSPAFQIPLYKMSPYNSQNTLISYRGFWSLYLPKTVTFRLTDIWRSYWAQRLMWLINETISFNGPNAYQLRNAHNYLKDFNQEKSMYLQTEKFVDFLFKWRCKHSKFYLCMLQLSEDMVKKGFWLEEEVESIKNWIHDLTKVGYKEPIIVNYENKEPIYVKCEHKLGDFDQTQIRYTPNFQKSLDSINYGTEINENFQTLNYFQSECNKFNIDLNYSSKINSTESKLKFNFSILITFNHEPYEKNIVILDLLYKNHFQNVIFCGSRILDKLAQVRGLRKKFDSYNFIQMINFGSGDHHYLCMSKAIEMGFKTDGFLLLSDDILIKFWNFKKFDSTKVWYPFDLILGTVMDANLKLPWVHWPNVRNLISLWKVLEGMVGENLDNTETKIVKEYLRIIDSNQAFVGNGTKVKGAGSDIFYVPKIKFESCYYMTNMMRKYGVYLELAVPMLMAGLENNQSVQIMNGHFEWFGRALDFVSLYQKIDFYHPFKLSTIVNENPGKQYCKFYLYEYFSNSF